MAIDPAATDVVRQDASADSLGAEQAWLPASETVSRSASLPHPKATAVARPARRLRTYNIAFSVVCALLLVLMGASYRFLVRTGETTSPSAAAERQQSEDVLFGSALFFRPLPYKIALYKLRKPEVVIVGSSRATQFVRRGFTRPMANMGSMLDLMQVRRLLDAMLVEHKPKLIIMTVDFWWFNSDRSLNAVDLQPDGPGQLSLIQLVQPFIWIAQSKITVNEFLAGALSPSYEPHGIGVRAIFEHAGYDTDGVGDYGSELTDLHPRQFRDALFATTLAHVDEQTAHNKFNVRTPLDEKQWQNLVDIVSLIQANGVDLILILPPVSKVVADRLSAGGPPILLNELNERLARIGVPVFDFHDPTSFGSSDCEFIDGFHGGRVTYLRMLDAIARTGRTDIDSFVDRLVIDRLIAENVGRATFRDDERPGEHEIDFLGLGCKK